MAAVGSTTSPVSGAREAEGEGGGGVGRLERVPLGVSEAVRETVMVWDDVGDGDGVADGVCDGYGDSADDCVGDGDSLCAEQRCKAIARQRKSR
jgi:hypothetical protein